MDRRETPDGDICEIRRAARLLVPPGSVIELRALNTSRRTVSGYFDDMGALAEEAARLSGHAEAVYATLNPVLPDLLARACNRTKPYARETTQDNQIARRAWLGIDFDAIRPSGISSTDEEHAAAIATAEECRAWLAGIGWEPPALADSGNGAHLLYRIALPNDDPARETVRHVLRAVAMRFDSAEVGVDQSCFNAARIWKLYGTVACKGDNTAERPHRMARLLDVPGNLEW